MKSISSHYGRIAGLMAMMAVAAFAQETNPVRPVSTTTAPAAVEAAATTPLIQIAILLDTSGSMNGLIEQAKIKLWAIVNQFATAKQKGRTPLLQVALYEYGKSSIPKDENYIRMIVPLSDDLDRVSKELFILRTNGGDEYCGAVIAAATQGLQWSPSNDDYKAIFICGNEPFTQGGVNYLTACKSAAGRGVIVNTIFCGPEAEGIKGMWKDGALRADGSFLSIDHNQAVAAIATPQDKIIATLGSDLNLTYVPYGKLGAEGKANQILQDANSNGVSVSNMAQRAASKRSHFYRNGTWDLVDACKDQSFDISKLKAEDLPECMRKMTLEEKKKYVTEQKAKRLEIQEKIRVLTEKRQVFVAEERKRQAAESGKKSLDDAIIGAVMTQAATRNFEFATPVSAPTTAPISSPVQVPEKPKSPVGPKSGQRVKLD